MLQKFLETFPELLNIDFINESTIVGFSVFPNSEKEVSDPEISLLIQAIKQYYTENNIKWDAPIALHPNKPKDVKIRRHLKTTRFIDFMNLKGFSLDKPKNNKYGNIKIDFGEGSRGGRGAKSKGFTFEDNFANDIRNFVLNGFNKKNFNYPNLVTDVIKTFNLNNAKEIIVKNEGSKNTKRPLIFKPNPEIENTNTGQKISDVTLTIDNKEHYLSLKFGTSILSLFNVGISKYLNTKAIKKGQITSRDGLQLLEMLNIDPILFTRVFNEYGTTNFKEYHTTAKPNNQLEKFIESSFGENYYTIHEKGDSHDIYFVDRKFAKESSKITSDLTIRYGGIKGNAKQIGVKFKTKNFIFNIKFRNSIGGIFPTHVFGEYKKL
jgi:hypothetical protein